MANFGNPFFVVVLPAAAVAAAAVSWSIIGIDLFRLVCNLDTLAIFLIHYDFSGRVASMASLNSLASLARGAAQACECR